MHINRTTMLMSYVMGSPIAYMIWAFAHRTKKNYPSVSFFSNSEQSQQLVFHQFSWSVQTAVCRNPEAWKYPRTNAAAGPGVVSPSFLSSVLGIEEPHSNKNCCLYSPSVSWKLLHTVLLSSLSGLVFAFEKGTRHCDVMNLKLRWFCYIPVSLGVALIFILFKIQLL